MELNVGRLISKPYIIDIQILERLQQIFFEVENHKLKFDFNLTHDERFPKKTWEKIIQNEILLLHHWTIKRIIYNQQGNKSKGKQIDNVYCFQPYYGITTHILRRVLPFAILNLNTICVFPTFISDKCGEILNYLADYFNLRPIKVIQRDDVNATIKDVQNNLLLVTGKSETFQYLRYKFKNSKVIGCVGSQGLIFADNKAQGEKFLKTIKQPVVSCTNITSIIVPDKNPTKLLDTRENKTFTLNNILIKYNPTIIYNVSSKISSELFAEKNYFFIDKSSKKDSQTKVNVGLCADPINSYPGDYLI